MVSDYVAFWKEDGHRVVNVFGTRKFVAADLVILHVNLSVVPQEFVDFSARYPMVINGGVTDIRKSAFSRNVIKRDDEYTGKVIVKSDLNYFGLPEWRSRPVGRRILQSLGLGGKKWKPVEYQIYDRVADVPTEAFDDPHLVVEKFIPEVGDGLYSIRTHVFFGNNVTSYRLRSKSQVIKFRNVVDFYQVDTNPDVVDIARQMDVDFGKIDYVVHDGQPFVLDINKTPSSSGRAVRSSARIVANQRFRAEGLYAYFDG